MNEELEKAILRTLAYSDIFDYPLRVSELHRYLIGLRIDNPLRFTSLFGAEKPPFAKTTGGRRRSASGGRGLTQISERNGFFFLQGRNSIIGLRQKREKIAQEKMQKAKKGLHVFKYIPFIKMVAVTGAVAAENANEDSDIDILIVTQKNRLWLARLFAVLLMELKGVRRSPTQLTPQTHQDKFCLNMFISEENLELPNKDLYTANEFARMKVVWDKDQTYERFVKANRWVRKFLPNWIAHCAEIPNSKSQITNKFQFSKFQNFKLFGIWCFEFGAYLLFGIWDLGLLWLEKLARITQLKYMERRKTTEVVTNGLLMFHPHDAREWVIKEYQKRLRELDLPVQAGIRD